MPTHILLVDIPTLPEFKALNNWRADACVSIYLHTTPLTQHVGAAKIELGNFHKEALRQLEAAGLDSRRRHALGELLDDLAAEEDFWRYQAHSLAILATPDRLLTFRLPNRLDAMVQVSDRFHLKPLLRSITFPHRAFILALDEKDSRVIEVVTDLPAREVPIKDLPVGAGTASGRAPEGRNVLLKQYARQIDAAIRPVLAGREESLVVAATEPLLSIWRSASTYPGLLETPLVTSPGNLSPAQLAEAVRPLLDAAHAKRIEAFGSLFATRLAQGRATTDLAQAARAATYGAIEALLVDFDEVITGTVDEANGAVILASAPGAASYGIVDEIAGRALVSGASVLGVPKPDIPGGAPLAAALRYPL